MIQKEKDLAVLRENIALLDRRLFREAEKRLPLFAELAAQVANSSIEAEDATPVTGLRREVHHLLPASAPAKVLPQHRAALQGICEAMEAADRVAYIQARLSLSGERGRAWSPSDFLPMKMSDGSRIAYVRNAYTDEAYEIFSTILTEPTVQYADSFREACQAVVAGEANFCILPFRSSSGLLTSFSELAERYSLYVCYLCRVFHADGTDATQFALYSQHILPHDDDDEDELRLRFSFLCPGTEMLIRHISAASMMEITIQELQAEPYPASEGALLCTATAVLRPKQLTAWLAYLFVFADGGTCHGLYKEI